jgi:protein pelota
MTAVERHIDWDIVKCLVLAGPGFVKDDFKKHLEEEAVRRDLRYLKMTFPSPTPH